MIVLEDEKNAFARAIDSFLKSNGTTAPAAGPYNALAVPTRN